MNLMPTLNENMIQAIQNELYEINPFVNVFYQTGFEADNYPDLTLTIHSTHGKDMRQYNQPTVPEIAAIILENYENTVIQKRDILLKTHTGKLQKISELHGAYDPLQYPLLFPYGEYGWHDNILRANEIITISDNEQSDDEFEEFDNEEFDPNQISIYQATSIAESTGATEAFENLLVRSASSMSTGSNIKRKKTEIEVSKEIVAVKKRKTEVEYNKEIFEIDNESENEIISEDEDLDQIQVH